MVHRHIELPDSSLWTQIHMYQTSTGSNWVSSVPDPDPNPTEQIMVKIYNFEDFLDSNQDTCLNKGQTGT